jgi:hypothetical protein
MVAAAWALLLTAIVLGPIVYGAFADAPGSQFTGSVEFYSYDSNTYMAWIRQASEGWWLLVDRYTTEPTGRCFFHPVFLALGLVVRLTGLPILTVWVAVRVLSSVAAAFCLFLFLRRAVGPGRHALIALAITTLGAGLGWYTFLFDDAFNSTDVWMPELTFYQSLRWPFLWAIALVMMMGFFAAAVDAITVPSCRAAMAAGVVFAAMALIHPYNVVTFTVVPGVFLLTEALRARRLDRRAVANYVVMGLVAAPAVLYQIALVRIDPVLKIHAQVDMASPVVGWYLAGFGPVLIVLALLGVRGAWRGGPLARFAVVWLAAGALLLYFPVSFNRRLAMGLMIPVGILASYPIEDLVSRLLGARPTAARVASATAVFLLVLASIAPTNLLATREDWRNALYGGFPVYISEDLAGAFEWLRNAPPGVVVAEGGVGNLIPAFTGQTVYAGHWAQTIDYGAKQGRIDRLLDGELAPGEITRFLIDSHVRYIIYHPFEVDGSTGAFDPATLGNVRYRSETVEIVEVSSRPSQPADRDG